MNDLLTEEQDPQFEELIMLLRQADLNPQNTEIISRARARLFPTDLEVSWHEDISEPTLNNRVFLPNTLNADTGKPYQGSRLKSLVSAFAVMLVVAALLSSYVVYSVSSNGNRGVPTPTASFVQVPDLRDMSWADASSTALGDGFQLKSQDGSMSGVVLSQTPNPGDQARRGSYIEVQMGIQKTTVPDIPKNGSLTAVEQILMSKGFQYVVVSAGINPALQPDTVIRINPSPGTSVASGSKVSIYVVNYTNGTPLSRIEPITAACL